jgi:hypothetical protein
MANFDAHTGAYNGMITTAVGTTSVNIADLVQAMRRVQLRGVLTLRAWLVTHTVSGQDRLRSGLL